MRILLAVALLLGLVALCRPAQARERKVVMPTKAQIRQMEDAAPDKAPARPARPRKLLVWGHVWTHIPNAFANEALKIMGRRAGAYEAVISDDPAMLLPDKLDGFDSLVMNNIHEREPFLPPDLGKLPREEQAAARKRDQAIKQSILDFVKGGKGVVGIHAATAAFQNWREYGEMMGGYYSGHMNGDVVLKLDDPDHPVNACFGGKLFRIREEIYFFRGPHSRKTLRVLLSFDLSQMKDPGKRPDKDYAVSWVRQFGKGRVFYTVLGHSPQSYWNPLFLKHLLAGIQFAIGDLKADATPIPK